jgi:hypothetical protein
MKTKEMPVVDLSLDWDFWSPEDPWWDWGHGEGGKTDGLFLATIWAIRYRSTRGRDGAHVDLFAATSHDRADFPPEDLLPKLRTRGVRAQGRRGVLGVGESHLDALGFLLSDTPPDALVHLDAHHDCYCPDLYDLGQRYPINCGNWFQSYILKRPTVDVTFVAPTWQDEMHLKPGPTARPLIVARWPDWPGLGRPHRLRHVFLCRSGAWVPPHHDEAFGDFYRLLSYGASRSVPTSPIYDRTSLVPTRADIDESRARERAAFAS